MDRGLGQVQVCGQGGWAKYRCVWIGGLGQVQASANYRFVDQVQVSAIFKVHILTAKPISPKHSNHLTGISDPKMKD